MPLTLGLKEGDGFSVGPYKFMIDKICSETQFRLRLPNGKFVNINDEHAEEVAKGVFVMSGTRGQTTLARVAIEADRSLKISRHQPYKLGTRTR